MKKLNRYDLDFDTTFKYVKNNLSYGHTLSKELICLNDFSNGYFYTLLPKGSNLNRIYKFEEGIILPQYPEMEYVAKNGEKNTYSIIPTTHEELANYILKKLIDEKELSCLFEDVISSPTDPYIDLFHTCGMSYRKEIYYLVNQINYNYKLILKCIHKCNAI